jgi:TP901 family phage tail tape measure protein
LGAFSDALEIVLKITDQASPISEDVKTSLEQLGKEARTAQDSLSKIKAFRTLAKESGEAKKAWKAAQDEVKRLATAMRDAGGGTAKMRAEFERAKKTAADLKREYDANRAALNDVRRGLREAGVDTNKLNAEQERLRRALANTQSEMKRISELSRARDMLGVRSAASARAEIDKLNKAYRDLKNSGTASSAELARAQENLKKRTREIGNEMTGLDAKVGKLGASFGRLMGAMAALAAIAFPIAEAAKFERAMAEVKAISGALPEEFARLEAVAQEMGRTTEYSSQQAAEGLKYLAMAGLTAEQSITALPSVLQLAQAGAMDLGQAADIATNIMTGFGFAADDLTRVNDVLVQTFTSTNSTLEELGYAFSYVGPIAAGLGVQFEDLAATLGALHNAGLKGSMAGTSLRGVLDTLFNPTKQEAEMMGVLESRLGGVSLQLRDTSGDFVGFESLIRQLQGANLSASEALKLFGQRAGPGMAALLGIGADAIADYIRLNEAAEGRSAKIAATMKENTVGAFKELQSAASGLAIEIGNHLLPIITKALRWLSDVTNAVTQWAQDNPKLTRTVTVLAGGIAGLTAALLAAQTAAAAMTVAQTAMAASAATMGGTVAGAGAAVGALASTVLSALAVVAAGFAGWKIGEWVGTLEMPFQGGLYKINEFVQVGYAKMGGFWNWLTGESNAANDSVIEDIDRTARARAAKTAVAEVEARREIELQRGIAAATEEISGKIEEVRTAWERQSQKLEQVQGEYDRLSQSAAAALDQLGQSVDASINQIWDNLGSGEAVTALQAQLLEIERAYGESEQRRRDAAIEAENELGQARVDATQAALSQTLELLEGQNQRRIALSETQLETQKAIIEREANSREEAAGRIKVAEDRAAEEIRAVNLATLEKKKQFFEQATAKLESELQKSLSREQSIADEIKGIHQSVAEARMSAEERIRALKQKGMTEEQRYGDQVKAVQEKIAAAQKIAATDTQAAIALFKDAQAEASSLGSEVKSGEQVVVSQSEAIRTAIGLVEQAQSGMESAASSRTAALDSALSATKSNTEAIQNSIATAEGELSRLTEEIGQSIEIAITMDEGDFSATLDELTAQREVLVEVKGEFSDLTNQLGTLNEQKLELAKEAEIRINADFDEQIRELQQLYDDVDALTGTEHALTVEAVDNASPVVEGVQQAADALEDHTMDVDADADQALKTLDKVKDKLEALDGKTYTSYHKVKSEMEASSAKPTTEKIRELEALFDQFGRNIETPRTQRIRMTGDTGSGPAPLTLALNQISGAYDQVKNKFERQKIKGEVSFESQQGTLKQQVDLVTGAYDQLFQKLTTGSRGSGEQFQQVMGQNAEAARKMAEQTIAHGEAMISQLSGQLQSLAAEIASVEDEMASIGTSTAEKIRQLQQNTMTDHEKWLDDKAEAERLYSQAKMEMEAGNYEKSKELMLASQDLAESLAREVTDANGEVVVSLGESTELAIGMVQKAGDGATSALKEQKSALEAQQASTQAELKKTEKIVDGMKGMMESFEKSLQSMMEKLGLEIKEGMAEVKKTVEEPMTPEVNISPAKRAFAMLADEASKNAANAMAAFQKVTQVGRQIGYKDITRQLQKIHMKEYRKQEKMWRKFSSKANIDFTGTGSTKKPLTEKIQEIIGLHGKMTGEMQKNQAQFAFEDDAGNPITQAMAKTREGFGKLVDTMKGGLNFPMPADIRVDPRASGSPQTNPKDLGKLTIGNQVKKGEVYGSPDTLKQLKDAIAKELRMGVA